jgi:hypothetical protein
MLPTERDSTPKLRSMCCVTEVCTEAGSHWALMSTGLVKTIQ